MSKENVTTLDNLPIELQTKISEVTQISQIGENSGMTSDAVFELLYGNTPAIMKISSSRIEPRQIGIPGRDSFKPYNPTILLNEFNVLTRINNANLKTEVVPTPKPLLYYQEHETEMSIQSKLPGTRMDLLELSVQFSSTMAENVGNLIARVGQIEIDDEVPFGSCADGEQFSRWDEFYSYIVELGVESYSSPQTYKKLVNLSAFKNIANSYDEWVNVCKSIKSVYVSKAVRELLLQDGTKTLCHGDLWQGNFFYEDDKKKVYLFDYDRSIIGGHSYDLALFNITGKEKKEIK